MNHVKSPSRSFVLLGLLSLFLLSMASAASVSFAGEPGPHSADMLPAYNANADESAQTTTKNHTDSDAEVSQHFGIGLRLGGSHFGVGANARYWSGKKLGFEVGYSRSSTGYSNAGLGYDASVNQVSPSLLYAISQVDRPTCLIRPYVGGGINLSRSSIDVNLDALGLGNDKQSSTNIGGQGFAGLELTFKKIPKLAFGGDVGYYSTSTPFTGIKIGGFALGATVHYYLK